MSNPGLYTDTPVRDATHVRHDAFVTKVVREGFAPLGQELNQTGYESGETLLKGEEEGKVSDK